MANVYIPEAGGSPNRIPHFDNVPVAVDLWEPVYKNLFEVNFILPKILRESGRDAEILMYNATNIKFPFTEAINPVSQRYKYSTRAYVTTPEKTHLEDITISFNINQSDKNSVVVWNTLKAWYDLVWNSQTGELHYKKDIVGTIIANQHDRRGEVIRNVTFRNCQLNSLSAIELTWDEQGIIEKVDANFIVDTYIDLYTDNL